MNNMKRLVLIDDDLGVLRALGLLLKSLGFDVIPFHSPLEAVNFLVSEPTIDLVVTDLRMPEISGSEVVQHIRSHSPKLPVIVMSGHASSRDILALRQYGASAFIPKPFTPQHFANAVAEIAQASAA
jgi:two-component system response regulator HydG